MCVWAHAHRIGEEWEVKVRSASGIREQPQGRPRENGRSHQERWGMELFPGQVNSVCEVVGRRLFKVGLQPRQRELRTSPLRRAYQ